MHYHRLLRAPTSAPKLVVNNFTATPNPVANGVSVAFDGSWAGGVGPFTWFFENGDTGGGAGGPQDERTFADSNTYSLPGDYTAALTVTDAHGATARVTIIIHVT